MPACLIISRQASRILERKFLFRMKAFLVGLIFLSVAAILTATGILFFPLLIILGWLLRLVISLVFIIFAIWLLGKLIIFILGQLRK